MSELFVSCFGSKKLFTFSPFLFSILNLCDLTFHVLFLDRRNCLCNIPSSFLHTWPLQSKFFYVSDIVGWRYTWDAPVTKFVYLTIFIFIYCRKSQLTLNLSLTYKLLYFLNHSKNPYCNDTNTEKLHDGKCLCMIY